MAINKSQCHYIMATGALCGSPAMRGHFHCYYHHQHELRSRRRLRLGGPDSTGLDFGTLEDGPAIQNAIVDVLHHLADKLIDRATAATMLYGLQLAMVNTRYFNHEPSSSDVCVCDLRDTVDCFDRHDHPDNQPQPTPKPAKSAPAAEKKPPASSNPARVAEKKSGAPSNPAVGANFVTRSEDLKDPELKKLIFGVPEIQASSDPAFDFKFQISNHKFQMPQQTLPSISQRFIDLADLRIRID
jgi:hypothetical protein